MEEDMQMQQDQYVPPMQPMVMDSLNTTENLKYMLDSSQMLEDFERMILGLEYDHDKKKWAPKHKPVANDLGVRGIMIRLRLADREIKLGNFDPEITKSTMKIFVRNISLDLNLRYKEWGINSLDRSYIIHLIVSMVNAAYSRGNLAHEKRFIRAAQYGMLAMNPMMYQQDTKKPWYKKANPFSK